MFNFQRSPVLLSIVASVILTLGFQNCTKSRFTSLEGAVLKAEALPTDSILREEGDDGQTVTPGDVPPNQEPSVDNPSSTPPVEGDKKGNSKNDETQHPSDAPSADLVECQMLHPNKKIVLSSEFEVQHTNSSSVRVCMSQNACLSLINAYAVANSCSLVPGESNSAGNQAQCTEIFPGSKGTCKNAAVLSDEQVGELLKKMSGQK